MELKLYPKPITRNDIPNILNERGIVGKGVEVGVDVGHYSKCILENWNGEKLYSIDPWKSFDEEVYDDILNTDQEEMDRRYKFAKQKLSKYGERSEILRMTSLEAVKKFEDRSLDFVYIDANHQYEEVKKDIEAWWPKVKKGGLFSGHDFLDGELDVGTFGVRSAVEEFATKRDLVILVANKNWMIFK